MKTFSILLLFVSLAIQSTAQKDITFQLKGSIAGDSCAVAEVYLIQITETDTTYIPHSELDCVKNFVFDLPLKKSPFLVILRQNEQIKMLFVDVTRKGKLKFEFDFSKGNEYWDITYDMHSKDYRMVQLYEAAPVEEAVPVIPDTLTVSFNNIMFLSRDPQTQEWNDMIQSSDAQGTILLNGDTITISYIDGSLAEEYHIIATHASYQAGTEEFIFATKNKADSTVAFYFFNDRALGRFVRVEEDFVHEANNASPPFHVRVYSFQTDEE